MSIFLEEIVKDKRYKSLCCKLTRNSHLSDDLYQEFILVVLEKGGQFFEDRFDTYLEVNRFCMGIISAIHGKSNRKKTYTNGKTSPLFELTRLNYIDINECSMFSEETEPNNFDIINHLDSDLDTFLLVVSRSIYDFRKFCKDAEIDYSNALYRINKAKKKYRNELIRA